MFGWSKSFGSHGRKSDYVIPYYVIGTFVFQKTTYFTKISGWVFHGFLIRVKPSDSCGFSYIAYSYSSILLIRLQKSFFRKIDFSPKSGKKPKISFPTIFSKMTFLNIFHRILVKKIHFGRFGQVSGGGDTSEPRVTLIKMRSNFVRITLRR